MAHKAVKPGINPKVSRRSFVKGSAGVAAATAVLAGSAASGERVLHALMTTTDSPPSPGQQEMTVFCPGGGCHQLCPLRAYVEDGRVTRTEAAPFADQPESTHACIKGVSSAAFPYNPDRLKYPMKRVGARGEGEWERISWDEALDTIAEKLIETRDKYGAGAVLIDHTGSSGVPVGVSVNHGAEDLRFENLFGSTLPDGWFDDTSIIAANFFTTGVDFGAGDPRDLLSSNLIVVWGGNPAETAFRDWKQIGLAQEKGARLVVIGPLFDPTAAKADWWIPVRSGTDAALALSMIQVIVSENLHDEEFLRRYTVGPLLVRDDDGSLLREADLVSGGSEEKFVARDEASRRPLVVEQGQHDVPDTLALTGRFTVEGVSCRPAFQRLVELVNEGYKPEQVAEITGIEPQTIRELAARYALAKPASIYHDFAARYYHGNLWRRAQMALASVCGYLGESGGGVNLGGMNAGWPLSLNVPAVAQPTDSVVNVMQLQEALEAAKTGEPSPIKMWINVYRNPIHCCPNPQRWLEDVIPNLDFIVNINIRTDWTAEYADILLPDATIFERVTISTVQDHVVLSGPAIEPLFEARTCHWIWSELGKRVGLGEHFQESEEDFLRAMLDSEDSGLQGITLEKLREAGGMLRANTPEAPFVSVADRQFDTPTGRIEFYSDRLLPYEEELPVYKPSLEIPVQPGAKYPLQFLTTHTRFYMQTDFGDLPVLKHFLPEPWLDINPDDAEARDIKNGDILEVFNDRGKAVLKAIVSSAVPPGVVKTQHGPAPNIYREGHYQTLVLPWGAKTTSNPVHELRYQLTRPWFKWAGGQADIINDCAVDVRKVRE